MRSTHLRGLLVAMATLCFLVVAAPSAIAAAPANDNFAAASAITGATFNVSGTNVEATAENGEPDHAGVSFDFDNANCGVTFDPTCEPSVWFNWTAPSTGAFQFQTCGSDFDTTLAIYTGNTVNALTAIASNDDGDCGTNGLGSVMPFNATSGTAYRIAVAGFDAEQGAFTLSTNTPPPPVIPPSPPVVPASFAPPPVAPQQKKGGKKKCGKKGGKKGGGKNRATASKKKCGKKGGGKGGGKKGSN